MFTTLGYQFVYYIRISVCHEIHDPFVFVGAIQDRHVDIPYIVWNSHFQLYIADLPTHIRGQSGGQESIHNHVTLDPHRSCRLQGAIFIYWYLCNFMSYLSL